MIASGSLKFTTYSLVALIALMPIKARSQGAIEMRDPLRGVTFYSVQISTDPIIKLQTKGGLFGQSDLMTLGLSAFFFDESGTVDEYVLWLRHDGPRSWFTTNQEHPLTLWLDDVSWQSAPLHLSRPAGSGESGPLIEKLEFILEAGDFQTLLNADSVTVELVTVLGTVEKILNETERSVLRRFAEEVQVLHAATQFAGAAPTSN